MSRSSSTIAKNMTTPKCIVLTVGFFAILGCNERTKEAESMRNTDPESPRSATTLTIADINSMPKGFEVVHTPNEVAAIETGNPDSPYRWEHRETVTPVVEGLTVQQFGYIVVVSGEPHLHSYASDGKPYDQADFVNFFKCEVGSLKKGESYTRTDWTENEYLEKSEMTSYFVGKNESGKLFSGYSKVIKLPQIKTQAAN